MHFRRPHLGLVPEPGTFALLADRSGYAAGLGDGSPTARDSILSVSRSGCHATPVKT